MLKIRDGVQKKTRRLRQRMNMHIYILPNLLTTGNMFFGFFAFIHAIQAKFIMAAFAIVAAAVFDLLDGRVARLTHSTSQFGKEYDSLSDLLSFGVAPGVLLFLWALQPFGRVGWLASFFYVACGALRLARFNVQIEVIESKGYFQGLPIPMAAGIVASSVLAFDDLGWTAHRSWLLLAICFLLGIVMVSQFPYRSFKDIDLKHRLPFAYLVLAVLIFTAIAYRPEVMLFALFLTYALMGAVAGVFKWGRHRRSPAGRYTHDFTHDVDEEDDLHEMIEIEEPEDPPSSPKG